MGRTKHNKWSVKQAEVSSSETHRKFNVTEDNKTIAAITSSYSIT